MISITFDDALEQHLDVAVRVLNECGLHGTFYAHLAAESLCKRDNDWRMAAAMGHELGNHTVFHPALMEKNWVSRGNAIDFYTLDRIRMELELANRWLESIDGCIERTFAFPCSNPIIGRHGPLVRALHYAGLRYTRWPGLIERSGLDFWSTRESYVPCLQDYFVAARGGGLTFEMTAPAFAQCDRYQLKSAACDGHTAEQMQGFITRSLEHGGWAILQFHGIGGGHAMDCSLAEFQQLIDWIAEHHRSEVVTVLQGIHQMSKNTIDKQEAVI